MHLSHKVHINVARQNGQAADVLESDVRRFPRRLMTLLFGDVVSVLVVTPGKSVKSVEIRELPVKDVNASDIMRTLKTE